MEAKDPLFHFKSSTTPSSRHAPGVVPTGEPSQIVDDLPNYEPPSFASKIYTPLAHSDSIRVLVLHPSVDQDSDIHCELLQIRISDCVEIDDSYVALSYVWGDLNDPESVYVNREEVQIGRNLAGALRHLRRGDHHLRLWADALCINQHDVSERNHQVHQMRDIYASAVETIVYLGSNNGSNTTSSAWNFLERNSEWALNNDGEQDFDLPLSLEDSLIYFRGDLSDVEIDVLTRPWFLRVWVLQEVVVSREVSIQCGHRRVPWDDFCKILLLSPRYHDRYGLSLRAVEKVEIVRDMFQARCAYQESHDMVHLRPSWHTSVTNYRGRSTDIIEMLDRARQLEASDPRDKIFALLGISTNVDIDDSRTAINYEKSAPQVYADFARYIMERTKSFDMLSYVNHIVSYFLPLATTPADGALPSWTPDWDGSEAAREVASKMFDLEDLDLDIRSMGANSIGPTMLSSLEEESEEIREKRQKLAGKSMTWVNNNLRLVTVGSIIGEVTDFVSSISVRGLDEVSFQTIRDQNKSDPREMRRAIISRWRAFFTQHLRLQWKISHVDPESFIGPLTRPEMSVNLLDDDPDLGPETIESHLFARGRQTAAWSSDDGKVINQVTDKASVIDGKLLGIYNEGTSNETRRVILPFGTSIDDWIVHFRGARVPFVVRPIADISTYPQDIKPGHGPHGTPRPWMSEVIDRFEIEQDTPFKSCKFIGECLINEFNDFVAQGEHELMVLALD
ncbi:hypothetical protein EsH8_IX_000840 [Colletotrichum jinshuiense]